MTVKAVHGIRRACTITLTLTKTVHGGSHCAVEKEAKRAMHIDYKNLPRPPGRFLNLKLEKNENPSYILIYSTTDNQPYTITHIA